MKIVKQFFLLALFVHLVICVTARRQKEEYLGEWNIHRHQLYIIQSSQYYFTTVINDRN